MLKRLTALFLLIIFISGCTEDDSNPVGDLTSLDGTWKTNGVFEYVPNRGVEWTWIFSNGSYERSGQEYRRDTITNNWAKQGQIENERGTFIAENNFIRMTSQNGSMGDDGMIWHYDLDGRKLTLNSAWDIGGIFNGSSDLLTGSTWTINYSDYDSVSNTFNTSQRQLIFNTDLTGSEIYKYIQSNYSDTTSFTYTISGNELTFFFEFGNMYKGIYKIADKKLYLYGKPGTSTNDDYWQFDLFKQ